MRFWRAVYRGVSLLLAFLILTVAAAAKTDSETALCEAADATASYCLSTVPEPAYGSEWLIVALAGGGYSLPDGYMDAYYDSVCETVSACSGELSSRKYSEYARVILGVTAAGYDASNVSGYDLTEPLSDYDATVYQGLNGPVFALIALDSGRYSGSVRSEYVDYILSRQLDDGGWAFSGTSADPDMTAMVLQSLSGDSDRSDVETAVEEGLSCLSALQDDDGGYASWGTKNSESCAQVILALCRLGIDLDDERFVKNGNTLITNLLTFQTDGGGFCHEVGGEIDATATQQAFLALVSALRRENGLADVYTMTEPDASDAFSDVAGHWAEQSIEDVYALGLFQGTSDTEFSPDGTMSRAMLVTVLYRLEREPDGGAGTFADVEHGAWYEDAVNWAATDGIVNGCGDNLFGTNDPVTREQLAVILYRYAAYKGYDVSAFSSLSAYDDAGSVSAWALTAVQWACGESLIMGTGEKTIAPDITATRAQVATILTRFIERYQA